jgi:Holliday junction resolvase
MLAPFLQFGHNYNYVSRAAMYDWINRHLHLGITNSIVESNYTRLTTDEMTVWDKKHPKPEGGPEFERRLLRLLTEDSDRQLAAVRSSSEAFRRVAGPAVDVVIGRNLSEVGDVTWTMKYKTDRGRYFEMPGLIRNTTHREELPVVFLYPKTWNKQTVIWLDGGGKEGLFVKNKGFEPIPEVRRLLDAGATVVGVDLLYQGEFLTNGRAMKQTRRVNNPREAAAYTFGYNPTLFAQRVHDILTVIKYVASNERKSEKIDVVGVNGAGPWVVAARVQAGDAIHRSVIDTGGFRFGRVLEIHSPEFLPGGAKYGDLPGMIALGDTPALIIGEDDRRWTVDSKADYAARSEKGDVAVTWLLK